MNRFLTLALRDLRLALRQGSDAATAVLFFVLTVLLFPLGIGPESNLLARIAAGTQEIHAPRGTILFHKGDPCIGFHLVVYGHVKLAFTSANGRCTDSDACEPRCSIKLVTSAK